MSIYEYDEEKTMRMLREEAYEDGQQAGFQDGLQNGLQQGRIQATINTCLDFNASHEVIIQKLMERFHFSKDNAQNYLNDYLSTKIS